MFLGKCVFWQWPPRDLWAASPLSGRELIVNEWITDMCYTLCC